MSMEQIIATVRGCEGPLVVVPEPGGDFPEIAWGDAFFYYAPDGVMPRTTQPYGTIVTKNYPDDSASVLAPPGGRRARPGPAGPLAGQRPCGPDAASGTCRGTVRPRGGRRGAAAPGLRPP